MKSRILDKMKFELKRGVVELFEQKAFPPVVSRFKNDLKELSITGHRKPRTTKVKPFFLKKRGGGRGVRDYAPPVILIF